MGFAFEIDLGAGILLEPQYRYAEPGARMEPRAYAHHIARKIAGEAHLALKCPGFVDSAEVIGEIHRVDGREELGLLVKFIHRPVRRLDGSEVFEMEWHIRATLDVRGKVDGLIHVGHCAART